MIKPIVHYNGTTLLITLTINVRLFQNLSAILYNFDVLKLVVANTVMVVTITVLWLVTMVNSVSGKVICSSLTIISSFR